MVPIWEMMNRRYPTKQGWLLFDEVRNKTGYGRGPEGYCDGMALSTWPSRGINLHGFEMKASRSDLIAELNQPAKADPFIRYCHFWWLVVEKPELVDGLEIPQTWGILAPKLGSLRELRPAPKLDPEPWAPTFIAALLRRFHDEYVESAKRKQDSAIDKLAHDRANKIVEQHRLHEKSSRELLQRDYDGLRDLVRRFQMASGLHLATYNLGDIARAVRTLTHGDTSKLVRRLDEMERIAQGLVNEVKEAKDSLAHAEPQDQDP